MKVRPKVTMTGLRAAAVKTRDVSRKLVDWIDEAGRLPVLPTLPSSSPATSRHLSPPRASTAPMTRRSPQAARGSRTARSRDPTPPRLRHNGFSERGGYLAIQEAMKSPDANVGARTMTALHVHSFKWTRRFRQHILAVLANR